jgi:hypothetical protein
MDTPALSTARPVPGDALPFLIDDAIKTLAAAAVLALVWWAIGEPHASDADTGRAGGDGDAR